MGNVGYPDDFNKDYTTFDMKVIYNSILPFRGFIAINLFGVVFVRKKYKQYANTFIMKQTLNHESIHTAQMRELLFIPYYLLYLLEWIYRLTTPPMKTAYRDISFEREAKANQQNFDYVEQRKPYSFIKYLRNANR